MCHEILSSTDLVNSMTYFCVVISKIYRQRFKNPVLCSSMLRVGDHLHQDIIVRDVGLFGSQSQPQGDWKTMARKSCLGTEPTPMDYFSESQDANNARAIVPAIKTEYVVVVRALIYNNSSGCHALILKTTPCRPLSIYMLLSDARAPSVWEEEEWQHLALAASSMWIVGQ